MAGLLHELLRRSCERHPERPAVCDGQRTVSYAELEQESNQLARLLGIAGVRPGDRVGLYGPKSAAAVIGVYGILKAGACYVPLDVHAPASRLSHIARDCGMTCLVTTTPQWTGLLSAGAPLTAAVMLGTADATETAANPAPGVRVLGRQALHAQPTTPLPHTGRDDSLAYILYTSGSTGTPKGVMLSHRNAMAFVQWATAEFALTPADRLASHAPFHFDLSVFDLFAAAAAAAAVVLVSTAVTVLPAEQAAYIETAGISVWYSVPSALSAMTRRGGLAGRNLSRLRTVLFAGEVFPTPQLRQLMDLLPHTRFANLYGPTETNVCTWYDVPPLPPDQTAPIPIGHPLPGVNTFVVADDGRPTAAGECGELYVQGPTVMQGYWNDAQRTRRALVPLPHGERAARAYRTGDLVRIAPDGTHHFLGRRDHQVKSRGYRIELGEIEAALHTDPAVVACAALALPDAEITNRLTACVVVRGAPDPARLARVCAERLPRYMCPESFAFHDTLPLTSTGKTDRAALTRALLADPGSRVVRGSTAADQAGHEGGQP
ncbi:amino acid adenylation domain-containing protein [Streptomyces sp. SID8352]|uniref:amino acid adenylation domain-containing protein n=1 Tax=Streptomyces sp. SID8352 TaxID=2690338 RepID=UPI0013684158|nr:amino acid adenylation domain-containing protein [Streptomyces sp. SID8352]MYU21137.1 amino acid adenylation domain-containing protein [Streptomyces sp. SID8352]